MKSRERGVSLDSEKLPADLIGSLHWLDDLFDGGYCEKFACYPVRKEYFIETEEDKQCKAALQTKEIEMGKR